MENRIISNEKISNDNIVFSYREFKFTDNKFILFIPIIFTIGILIFEMIYSGTAYLQLICLPTAFFIYYKHELHTFKKNYTVESKVINESLADIIKHDIETFGKSEKEITRKYFLNDDINKYITTRYLLIVLSNGLEIKYDIINEKYYNHIVILEIDTHFKMQKR